MTKVLILAGGKGTRLWPLTDDNVRPKPNVYVGGHKRLLEYILDCFVRAGYSSPYIAVQHMEGSIVNAFRDGSGFVYDIGDDVRIPLSITYTRSPPDKQFRGTADALRKSRVYLADRVVVTDRETQAESQVTAEEYLQNKKRLKFKRFIDDFGTIVVGSGDILTNFDISSLVRLHHERGTIATIATYRMDDINRIVGELGTLEPDSDGNVASIDEKPKTREQVKSNIINAGIYVFDASILDWLDSRDDVTDFAKHVFPELMREGKKIYMPVMEGYWNDLGTIDNYRRTNLHLIKGIDEIDIGSHIQRPEHANRVLGTSRNSMLSQGCMLEPDSRVFNSVLGNDVAVRKGAKLNGCVVYSETEIGEGVESRGAVIDGDVVIEKGAKIGNYVVIGKGARIKSGAVIHSNVKIGPGETITGEVSEDVRD